MPTISYVSPSISVIIRAGTLSVITRSRRDFGDRQFAEAAGRRRPGAVPLQHERPGTVLSNWSVTTAIVVASSACSLPLTSRELR